MKKQKDAKTGLEIESNILEVNSFSLSLATNNQPLSSNEVEFGETLYITLNDVKGFVLKNNNCFPGCEIVLTDSKGNQILYIQDAYERYSKDGVSQTDARTLNSDLNIGYPMQINETYVWKIRFWDKEGKGEIKSELNLKVKANRTKIDYKTEGNITISTIYYTDGQRVLLTNEFEKGKKIYLFIKDATGFTVKNNKINLGWSLLFTDSKGNIILKQDDLFSADGINPEDVKNLNMHLSGNNSIKSGESYIWKTILWDKNSNAKISTEAILKAK